MAKKLSARFWETFVELFHQSVVIQGGVTATMIATVCAMLFLGRDVPKEMWGLTGIVLGYWFGTKKDATHARDIEVLAKSVQEAQIEMAGYRVAGEILEAEECGCEDRPGP